MYPYAGTWSEDTSIPRTPRVLFLSRERRRVKARTTRWPGASLQFRWYVIPNKLKGRRLAGPRHLHGNDIIIRIQISLYNVCRDVFIANIEPVWAATHSAPPTRPTLYICGTVLS